MSYLWIGSGGGAGGIIKFSVTENVTCPALITFLPLMRCGGGGTPQGGGLKVTAEKKGVAASCQLDRTAVVGGVQMRREGGCLHGTLTVNSDSPVLGGLSPQALFSYLIICLAVSFFPPAGISSCFLPAMDASRRPLVSSY